MLQYDAIPVNALKVLRRLKGSPSCSAFDLGGGTALALHIGHRELLNWYQLKFPGFDLFPVPKSLTWFCRRRSRARSDPSESPDLNRIERSPQRCAQIRPWIPQNDRKSIMRTPKTLTRPLTRVQITPRWMDFTAASP